MQKLAFIGGAAALGLGALLGTSTSTKASDHVDSPTLATNPMADINDVYAWMTTDGTKVNLAMSISPADPGTMAMPSTRTFGPSILYVFHVTSTPGIGMAGTTQNVICQFQSDTDAQCWVGTTDYVKGDPSNTAGVTSTSGKVRLFAGLRSDPFFFNEQGFRDAIKFVQMNAAALTFDKAGCPQLDDTTASVIRGDLQEMPQGVATGAPCSMTNKDCFISLNAKVILLQIDSNLLNMNGHTLLGVWASTNMVGA